MLGIFSIPGSFKLYNLLNCSSISLQLQKLASNILGRLCKSQLRFDSCDITFTSNKLILIDWLICRNFPYSQVKSGWKVELKEDVNERHWTILL